VGPSREFYYGEGAIPEALVPSLKPKLWRTRRSRRGSRLRASSDVMDNINLTVMNTPPYTDFSQLPTTAGPRPSGPRLSHSTYSALSARSNTRPDLPPEFSPSTSCTAQSIPLRRIFAPRARTPQLSRYFHVLRARRISQLRSSGIRRGLEPVQRTFSIRRIRTTRG
jgi:hypothetical protein